MSNETFRGSFYLVCQKPARFKSNLSARLTKTSPSLGSDEVAIKLSVELPQALFSRPALQASVVVPVSAVPGPIISSTVIDNIREVMSQQLGIDMEIALVEKERPT